MRVLIPLSLIFFLILFSSLVWSSTELSLNFTNPNSTSNLLYSSFPMTNLTYIAPSYSDLTFYDVYPESSFIKQISFWSNKYNGSTAVLDKGNGTIQQNYAGLDTISFNSASGGNYAYMDIWLKVPVYIDSTTETFNFYFNKIGGSAGSGANTNFQLYYNNSLKSTLTTPHTGLIENNISLSSDTTYEGFIDKISIFSYPLSASDNTFVHLMQLNFSYLYNYTYLSTNQLPQCSINYNQSLFYYSSEDQYFTFDLNATDADGDELYYSEGQFADFTRNLVYAEEFDSDWGFCDRDNLVTNSSCYSNKFDAQSLISGLYEKGITLVQLGQYATVGSLYVSRGVTWDYILDTPIPQTAQLSFNLIFNKDDALIKIAPLGPLNSYILNLTFVHNNSRLMIYNSSNLILNASDSIYTQVNQNSIGVVIQMDNVNNKTRLYVDNNEGELLQFNDTSNFVPLSGIRFDNTNLQQNNPFYLLQYLHFSGFDYYPNLVFTTTKPTQTAINFTGTKILKYFVSDLYHKPDTYCSVSVVVDVLSQDYNTTSSIYQSGELTGDLGSLYYGVLEVSELRQTFYDYSLLAYVLTLVMIIFITGASGKPSIAMSFNYTNIIFVFFGALRLIPPVLMSWCMICVAVIVASYVQSVVYPFAGDDK